MIGSVPLQGVQEHAEALAAAGGPPAPRNPGTLEDFTITGHAEIYAMTRAAAADGGSVLMSSGGTTGTPKLTHVPYGMGLDRLLRTWRPLTHTDVLLNLFTPGRMWGSHYYMQALAEQSRCTVIPSGSYPPGLVAGWLPLLRGVQLSALAGTPTALADFAEGVLAAGETLPQVRVIIWMGESWTAPRRTAVGRAFPQAGLWGNYGSVETWVMGTNDPGCDEDVLHLLPDQAIEPDEDGALLTRTGDGWTVPTVRYRLGDRIEPASCRCGRPDGLRILGRADDAISLCSALFRASELLDLARSVPGVLDAQLVLTRSTDTPSAASALAVEFTGTAEPEEVRRRLVEEHYHLTAIIEQYPQALSACRVEALRRISRTNKSPSAIWQEPPAGHE